MRAILSRFTAFCGANPLQLLVLAGCFALAGYVFLLVSAEPTLPVMLAWFAGAVISHDLLLFPLYALADRSLAGARAVLRPARRGRPEVPAVNYVRLPVLGSGLLLLLFFPGIVEQGTSTYLAATGQTQDPFLLRWLLITAVLFGTSALAYAVRLALTKRGSRGERAPADG